MQIIEKLDDLIKQATTERSHYYVRSVAEDAKRRIGELEAALKNAKASILDEHYGMANRIGESAVQAIDAILFKN